MTTEKMFKIQGRTPFLGPAEKRLGWMLHYVAYVVCIPAYNKQTYRDYDTFSYGIKMTFYMKT